MGSSPTTGSSLEEVTSDGLDMAALFLHEELKLGEDLFVWLHPTNPHEALFMVDYAADRAMWVAPPRAMEGSR